MRLFEHNPKARAIFRLGPAPVVIPIALLWATACNLIGTEESRDWWRINPLVGAFALTAVWHLALVIAEAPRLLYVVYAALHLPAYTFFHFFAVVFATRFPL